VTLLKDEIDPNAIRKVPAKLAFHYKVLPVAYQSNRLTLMVSNPLDQKLYDELQSLLGCEITVALGDEQEILCALEEQYGLGAETLERLGVSDKAADSINRSKRAEVIDAKVDEGSIVKLVNQLLLDARKSRASDIHLEPYTEEFRVRYRVDGILYDAKIPPAIKQYQTSIISRIKVMANLDIAEKRLPQDGRIKIKTQEEELDLRISVLPTMFGEAVVIRLLSPSQFLCLEKVGLSSHRLETLRNLLKNPHGIIFLTGPTGSGKTTTLYACLNELNDQKRKILTIEDPVEYQLKGIVQIQVHPKIGLSFSQGLRHLLRHDPDILMVGEVRDLETAEITIRTALTGHLVFSTLHTNDAPGAVARLLDMGVEPYLAASSTVGVIAQRLVRLICPQCKIAVRTKDQPYGGKLVEILDVTVYEGKGCEMCKKTGYLGRTAIHELMVVDDEIRSLISHRVPTQEIKKLAVFKGMKSLFEDGLEKVKQGITTLSEILRVIPHED